MNETSSVSKEEEDHRGSYCSQSSLRIDARATSINMEWAAISSRALQRSTEISVLRYIALERQTQHQQNRHDRPISKGANAPRTRDFLQEISRLQYLIPRRMTIQEEGGSVSGSTDQSSTSSIRREEGWEDLEPDVENITFKSLLDNETFLDVRSMLDHCKAKYAFDFVKIQKDLGVLLLSL